jgi:hypothetical protein
MRSLQLSLNDFIPLLGAGRLTVTKMAYSKARHKLKHTAFIELNQTAVVHTMYEDGDYATFNGFRILGIDGSKVQLPDTDEIRETFGTIPYDNKLDAPGEHPYALASVCYDVLNRIALDAQLLPCRTYEVTAAIAHLAPKQWDPEHIAAGLRTGKGDLLVYDRNYHAFLAMAATQAVGADFLIRCKRRSGMPAVEAMFRGEGADDQITMASPPRLTSHADQLRQYPSSLQVRLVRLVLKDGSVEVLEPVHDLAFVAKIVTNRKF